MLTSYDPPPVTPPWPVHDDAVGHSAEAVPHPLLSLPQEMLGHILEELDAHALLRFASVSTRTVRLVGPEGEASARALRAMWCKPPLLQCSPVIEAISALHGRRQPALYKALMSLPEAARSRDAREDAWVGLTTRARIRLQKPLRAAFALACTPMDINRDWLLAQPPAPWRWQALGDMIVARHIATAIQDTWTHNPDSILADLWLVPLAYWPEILETLIAPDAMLYPKTAAAVHYFASSFHGDLSAASATMAAAVAVSLFGAGTVPFAEIRGAAVRDDLRERFGIKAETQWQAIETAIATDIAFHSEGHFGCMDQQCERWRAGDAFFCRRVQAAYLACFP